MRMSNEAFEAAVRSRAAEYKRNQARKKRILMTVCPMAACLMLVVGIGLYKNGGGLKASNTVNMDAAAPAQNDNALKAGNNGTHVVATGKRQMADAEMQENNCAAEDAANQYARQPEIAGKPDSVIAKNAEAPSLDAEFPIKISLQETVIQQGAKSLNLMLTNSGSREIQVSSVQFLLTKKFEDGNAVGFTKDFTKCEPETCITVPAGETVPFAFALDQFTETLSPGTYTLSLFTGGVQFTIQ